MNGDDAKLRTAAWDHTTHREFYEYYAGESESEATLQRFGRVLTTVVRIAEETGMAAQLEVADISCDAGTQCRLSAERGHRMHGVDINEP